MLSDGGPLWARLRNTLRGRILSGDWAEGALVPSETQLCEAYGVSRITATRALNELVREGLVVDAATVAAYSLLHLQQGATR